MFRRTDTSAPTTNKPAGWFALSVALVFFLWPVVLVWAENIAGDHDLKQQLERVEAPQETQDQQPSRLNQKIHAILGPKISLSGVVELNYEYLDIQGIDDEDSDPSSDFFLSTAELALSLFFNDWSKANIVVAAEDAGRQGDSGQILLDEAIATLKGPQAPLYITGGKTVMPFGVFEDHLIEGTLAEDLYEIDEWGLTLGFAPGFYGLDISLSGYRNPQLIHNLKDFGTHNLRPERQRDDPFRSFIANLTAAPLDDTLKMSVFFNSEPGDGRRNESIGGAVTLNFWNFILNAEAISALQREKGLNGIENKERAAVLGLAFSPLDALQLVARYAVFDDDNPGDQDEVLDYRFVAGFNYTLGDIVGRSFLNNAIFSFEYRFSRYEKEADSRAADSQNMFQFQLALEF